MTAQNMSDFKFVKLLNLDLYPQHQFNQGVRIYKNINEESAMFIGTPLYVALLDTDSSFLGEIFISLWGQQPSQEILNEDSHFGMPYVKIQNRTFFISAESYEQITEESFAYAFDLALKNRAGQLEYNKSN